MNVFVEQTECMCLLELSDELLENIFAHFTLCDKDLANLSITCHRMYSIIQSNELWKKKLFKRWPEWLQRPSCSFQSIYKSRHVIDHVLIKQIKKLSQDVYSMRNIPDASLESIQSIYNNNSEKTHLILESLYTFANTKSKNEHLDQIYYAEKIYQYVFRHQIKLQLLNIAESTDGNKFKDIEKGMLLISQWLNINMKMDEDNTTHDLDKLSCIIKNSLPEYEYGRILPFKDTVEIIKSFNNILYNDLLKQADWQLYFLVANSTRKVTPVSVCVFYIIIANRLGLCVEGVTLPGYFIVRIKTSDSGCVYIDAFKNGMIRNENQCLTLFLPNVSPQEVPNMLRIASKKEIFANTVADVINLYKRSEQINPRRLKIVQSSLELLLLLSPNDDENRLFLSRIYLHQGVNLDQAANHLTILLQNGRIPAQHIDPLLIATKSRLTNAEKEGHNLSVAKKYRFNAKSSTVIYRIGMVMKHLRFDYLCVIYGWDESCDMPDNWKREMGVYDLPHKDQQPFYNVLANDGTTRYASQESLTPHTVATVINHEEIGKHFHTYDGNMYHAIECLRNAYPDDQPYSNGDGNT